jgi:cell division protein FtsN
MGNQRGGTFLGFVLGLVVGLGVALAVAVYVTKVPIPFVSKASTRSADQDAQEVQKNKDWNPNAPLQGKVPPKPAQDAASAVPVAPAVANAPAAPPAPPAPVKAEPKAESKPDAKAPAKAEAKPEPKPDAKGLAGPAASADPIGDLARAKAAGKPAPADADPFQYFVQLGAYRTADEAESQRAKYSLAGIDTKLSEREQSGRIVHRVRMGPFERREEAERAKAKLDASNVESVLVRVQRAP